MHLRGEIGEDSFLKPDTFKTLHQPPKDESYAMGWAVIERPWADGNALVHSGSNTMWFASVAIAANRKIAFLVAANMGPSPGQLACDESLKALIESQLPSQK
jgi:hypothetical protein